MSTGWAATNTLRRGLSRSVVTPLGQSALNTNYESELAALALVETALDAADKVLTGMTPLRSLPGAVGTIGTEDLEALAAALRAVREGK